MTETKAQRAGRTMRTVGFRRYGQPDVLEPLEVPRPEPGLGEVLLGQARPRCRGATRLGESRVQLVR